MSGQSGRLGAALREYGEDTSTLNGPQSAGISPGATAATAGAAAHQRAPKKYVSKTIRSSCDFCYRRKKKCDGSGFNGVGKDRCRYANRLCREGGMGGK